MYEDDDKETTGADQGKLSSLLAYAAASEALQCSGSSNLLSSPALMPSSTPGPAVVGRDFMNPDKPGTAANVMNPGTVIRVGINELMKNQPASVKTSPCKKSLSLTLDDPSVPIAKAQEASADPTCTVCPTTDGLIPNLALNVCDQPSTTLMRSVDECIPQKVTLSSSSPSFASSSVRFPVSSGKKSPVTSNICNVNKADDVPDHDTSTQDALLLLSLSTSLYDDAPETASEEDPGKQKTLCSDESVVAGIIDSVPAASAESHKEPAALAAHVQHGGIVTADVTNTCASCDDESSATFGQDLPVSGKYHVHQTVSEASCLVVPADAQNVCDASGKGNVMISEPILCDTSQETPISARHNSSPVDISLPSFNAGAPIANDTRLDEPTDILESAAAANLTTSDPGASVAAFLVSSTGHDASHLRANATTGVTSVDMAARPSTVHDISDDDQEQVSRDVFALLAPQRKSSDSTPINHPCKNGDFASANGQGKHRDDVATDDQSKQRKDVATNGLSKQRDDTTINDQSKQSDDAVTNDQGKQRVNVATNVQGKQRIDAATNDHCKHSDEVLENDASKSLDGCLASAENKPCNDPLSAYETEHTDVLSLSDQGRDELTDWDQGRVADQYNYLTMIDNDDEFYDDVSVTEQDEKMLLGESTPRKKRLHKLNSNTDDASNSSDILCISKISDGDQSTLSENSNLGNVLSVENSAQDLKCSKANFSETARPQSGIVTGQSMNLLQETNAATHQSLIGKESITPSISADINKYVTPQTRDVGVSNVISTFLNQNSNQASETVSVGRNSTDAEGNVTVDNSDKLNKLESSEEAKSLKSEDLSVKNIENDFCHKSGDGDIEEVCTNEKESENPSNVRTENDSKVAPCQSSDMLMTVEQGETVTSDNTQVNSAKLDQFPTVKAKVVESVIPLTIEIRKSSKLHDEKFQKGLVRKLLKLESQCADKALISKSSVIETSILKSAMPDKGIESYQTTSALILNNIKAEIDDNYSETVRKIGLPAESWHTAMACNQSSSDADSEQTADVGVTSKQDIIGSFNLKKIGVPDARAGTAYVLSETSKGSRIHSCKSSASANTSLASVIRNDSATPNQLKAHAEEIFEPESHLIASAATHGDSSNRMKSPTFLIKSETFVMPQTPSFTSATSGDINTCDPKSFSNTGTSDASFHVPKIPPIKLVTSDDTSFLEPKTPPMMSAATDGVSFHEPKLLSTISASSSDATKSASASDASFRELETSMKSAPPVDASFIDPKNLPVKSATSDDASLPEPKTFTKSVTLDEASFIDLQIPKKSATSDNVGFPGSKTSVKSALDDASFFEPKTPLLKSATSDDAYFHEPKTPPMNSSTFYDVSFHEPKPPPMKLSTSDDASCTGPKTPSMKSATSDDTSFLEPKTPPMKSAASNDASFSGPISPPMKSAASNDASFSGPISPPMKSAASNDASFSGPKTPPMKSAVSDNVSFRMPKTPLLKITNSDVKLQKCEASLLESATCDDVFFRECQALPGKFDTSDNSSFPETKTLAVKLDPTDCANVIEFETLLPSTSATANNDVTTSSFKHFPTSCAPRTNLVHATSDKGLTQTSDAPRTEQTHAIFDNGLTQTSDAPRTDQVHAISNKGLTQTSDATQTDQMHAISDKRLTQTSYATQTDKVLAISDKGLIQTSDAPRTDQVHAISDKGLTQIFDGPRTDQVHAISDGGLTQASDAPQTDRAHTIFDKEMAQTTDSEDDLLTIDENVIQSDTAEIDEDFLNNLSIKTNASFLPGLNSPVIKRSIKKKELPSSLTTSKPTEKLKVSGLGKTSTDNGKNSLDDKSISDAKPDDVKKKKSSSSKKVESKTKYDDKHPLENLKRAFSEDSTVPSKPVSRDLLSTSGLVKKNGPPSNESLHVSNMRGKNIAKLSLDEKLASVKASVRRDSESNKRSTTSTDKKVFKLIRPKEISSQSASGKHSSDNAPSKKSLLVDNSGSSSSRGEKHLASSLSKDLDRDRRASSVSRHSEHQTKKSKTSYLHDKSKATESEKVKLKSSDADDKSLRYRGLKQDEMETQQTKKERQNVSVKSTSKQSTGEPPSKKISTPSENYPNDVFRDDSVKLGRKATEKDRVASKASKSKKHVGMEAANQKRTSVVKPTVNSEEEQINKKDDFKNKKQCFVDKGCREKIIDSRQSQGDSSKSAPVELNDTVSKTKKSDWTEDTLQLLGAASKRVLESQRESVKFPAKKCQNLESAKTFTKTVENIAPAFSNPQSVPGVHKCLEPKLSRKKDCSPTLEKNRPSKKQKTSPELVNTMTSIKHTVSTDIPRCQEMNTHSVSPELTKKDPKKTPLIFSDPCSDLVITSVIGSVNLNDCSNAGSSSRPSAGTSTTSAGDRNQPDESTSASASASCCNSSKRNEVEELACSWCRDVWNHYILHSLFRSACAVTVKSRITFGAIYLMYHWATNEKLPDKHEAIYNLLDRADLSKNLQGKNISMLVDWITSRLKSKEQQCCDVFSLVYLTDSSISEKLKGFSTPSFRQKRASVVKADLVKSTRSPPEAVPTSNFKPPSAPAAPPIAVHADPRALAAKVANVEKETLAQFSKIDCSDVVVVGTKRCQIDDVSGTRKKVKLDVPGEKCVDTPNTNVNANVTKADSFLQRKALAGQLHQQQKLLVPILMGCGSANSRILRGAKCAENVKNEIFAEYNSMSSDVKEVFCNMPFERSSLEYNPDLKRTVRFTTVREVIALHNLCVIPTHVDNADEARLLYRSTVQLLAARGVVLLLPDGPSLIKVTERLRKHYHRSQHVIETDLFLKSRWMNDVAFTKMMDWKKIPQNEITLSAVLALFCLWKNWDHLPLIQNTFRLVPHCTSSDGQPFDVSKSNTASINAHISQEQRMNTTSHKKTPVETESSTLCGQSTLSKSSDEPSIVTEISNQRKQTSQSFSLQTNSPLQADFSEESPLVSSSKSTDSSPIEATTSQTSTTSSADRPKPRPPLREFLLEQNVDVSHHVNILKDCLRLYDKFTYYAYVMNDLANAQLMLSRPWLAQVRLQQIQALLMESSANEKETSVKVSDAVVPIGIGETTAPNLTENHSDLAITAPIVSKPPINRETESEKAEVSKSSKSSVEDSELVQKELIANEKTRKGSPRDATEFKKSTICDSEFKDGTLLARRDGIVALSEWVTFKQNSLLQNIMEMSCKKRPLPSKNLEQESITSKKSCVLKDSNSVDESLALSKTTAVGSKDGGRCVETLPSDTVTSNAAPLKGSRPSDETGTSANSKQIDGSNGKGLEPALVDEEDIPDHLKLIVKHLLQLSKPNKSMIPSIIRNSFQLLGRNDVRLPNNETISRYVNSIAT